MVLWEVLRGQVAVDDRCSKTTGGGNTTRTTARLPYETRCSAVTKAGKRCRGRIRADSEFCAFHDPAIADKRREAMAEARRDRRRRYAHVPEGYLRKLTNRTAVGRAMDRLFREVRLGAVTPEMGSVLFGILTRLLDSELCGARPENTNGRARADLVRPKLSSLLTRAERLKWRAAVQNAPEEFFVGASRTDQDGVPVASPLPMRAHA